MLRILFTYTCTNLIRIKLLTELLSYENDDTNNARVAVKRQAYLCLKWLVVGVYIIH